MDRPERQTLKAAIRDAASHGGIFQSHTQIVPKVPAFLAA